MKNNPAKRIIGGSWSDPGDPELTYLFKGSTQSRMSALQIHQRLIEIGINKPGIRLDNKIEKQVI